MSEATGDQRVIRASAGAGKTYALTGHYLSLLERGAKPQEILATTFTRKAAGEIFGRVLTRLADAADQDPAARKQLLALAGQLNRVAIGTLDSFFNRLGSAFRFELDLPVEPQVVDDKSSLAHALRWQAIGQMLEEAAERKDDFSTLLRLLERLHHDDRRRSVTEAIDKTVRDHAEVYAEAPDLHVWDWLEPKGLASKEQLAAAVDRVAALEGELPQTKSGKPNGHWAKAWAKDVVKAQESDFDGLLKAGMVATMASDKTAYYNIEFTDVWYAAYGPLVAHAQALLVDRIARQTVATHGLMKRFAHRYDALRRERGVLLYSDVAQRLANLVTDGRDDLLMEMQFRIDASLTHLLLDEFQDTSLMQWRVLEPFVDEIAATGDGSRSLFVVGDAKQAIYGWRGGCVELFDAADMRVPPEGRGSLAKSYRSSPVVLNFVNAVFASLPKATFLADDAADLAAAQAWTQRFEPHVAAKTNLPGYVCFEASEVASDDAEGDGDESLAESHEAFVAARVAQIHHDAPQATIGILVGTNAAADTLLLALRRAGLPASGEGGNPLADHPAVAAVLAAFTLADHPGDGPSAFHVMAGPMGRVLGFTLDHTADVKANAQKAVRVAGDIRAAVVRDGYAQTVATWAQALAEVCDEEATQKLAALVNLADAFDADAPASATLRCTQFVDYVAATAVEEPTASPIRVMTVHRSKGLEFDAVVLPQLDRKLGFTGAYLVDRPDPLSPIERVVRWPSAEARDAEPELARIYAQNRQRRREEDFSALYVALTRARQALYLPVQALGVSTKGKRKTTGVMASILRELLGDPEDGAVEYGDAKWGGDGAQGGMRDEMQSEAKQATHDEQASPKQTPRLNVAADSAASRLRLAVSPSDLPDDVGRDGLTGAALLQAQSPRGLAHGAGIHADFEVVDYVDANDGDALEALPQTVKNAMGFPAVVTALSRRFENEELWRERPFAVIHDGRLLRGAFDRVALGRDAEGKVNAVHLIDFKTDTVDPNDPAWQTQKAALYQGQINAYRAALSVLLDVSPDNITAELLFVGVGVSVLV